MIYDRLLVVRVARWVARHRRRVLWWLGAALLSLASQHAHQLHIG